MQRATRRSKGYQKTKNTEWNTVDSLLYTYVLSAARKNRPMLARDCTHQPLVSIF